MLVSEKELANLKLESIRAPELKELAADNRIDPRGSAGDLIKRLINMPSLAVDSFIRKKYQMQVDNRRRLISDGDLLQELQKLDTYNWGVVQGRLDQKIQIGYVRKFFRYNELISNVKDRLHDDITSYVVASWYNHWSTVLVEDHLGLHPEVVPVLKDNFPYDLFFGNQPFDLKITYLPGGWSFEKARDDPRALVTWMYENQGDQRFSANNRLYVILVDENNLQQSWMLKRNLDLVFGKVDSFLFTATVSQEDEIVFNFKGKTYTTIAKVLIITK